MCVETWGRFDRRSKYVQAFRISKHGAYEIHMSLRDVFLLPPCWRYIEDFCASYEVFFLYGLDNPPSGIVQPGSVVLFRIFPFSASSGVVVVSGLASISGGSVSTASGFFFASPSSRPR